MPLTNGEIGEIYLAYTSYLRTPWFMIPSLLKLLPVEQIRGRQERRKRTDDTA